MSINYFHRNRSTAIISIEKLIVFIKDLHDKYPDIGFGEAASDITRVKKILSQANDRCLTDSHIDNFRRFGDMLVNNLIFGSRYFHSLNIQPKLSQVWALCQDILYAPNPLEIVFWRLNPKLSNEDQVNALTNSLEKVNKVKVITSLIVTEFQNSPNNILSITSILLTLIIRVETHEYELMNILKSMNRSTQMHSDIEDLLSVESKVKKGDVWRTDVRAIRDATAHAKFKINSTNYQISFDNNEGGYNFTLTKTGEELLFFYQDYDRMLNLQSRLATITLLIALLNNVFRIN